MKTAAVVGLAALAAGVVGAVVVVRRRRQQQPAAPPVAAAAVLPSAEKGAAGAGVAAAVRVKPAGTGVGGELAAQLAKKGAEKAATALFGAAAGTVQMGFKSAELQRQLVTRVAGQGLGNTAAVFGPTASIAALTKTGAEKFAARLGVPADLSRKFGQTAALATVPVFGGALVQGKVVGELGSLGIRAIAGARAERDVRNAFKSLDPTNHRNLTHKPIALAAKGVQAVSNIFGGIFGKKKKR